MYYHSGNAKLKVFFYSILNIETSIFTYKKLVANLIILYICTMYKSINFSDMRKLILFLTVILFVSCSKDDNDTKILKLRVASEVKIFDNPPNIGDETSFLRRMYWVKFPGDKQWRTLYPNIEGFEHEAGYEYVLKVEQTEPVSKIMDAPIEHFYKLLKVISKEKKQSEGLSNE